MKPAFRVINCENDFKSVLDESRFAELTNYAFTDEECIVIEGNVIIDGTLNDWCDGITKKLKRKDIHSFIFVDDLWVNRVELEDIQVIVLGKTKCSIFIEDSYHYFYGRHVEVENLALFNRTSGCVLIDELVVPILFASDNFPIVKKLGSKTFVLTEGDVNFIEEGREYIVQKRIEDLSKAFLDAFEIEDFEDIEETIYSQKTELLQFLEEHALLTEVD